MTLPYVSSLSINNFRNYKHLLLKFDEAVNCNLIYGSNGAGKTNILESFSVFANKNGMRGANIDAMQCNFSKLPWGVAITLSDGNNLAVGIDNEQKRRYKINSNNVKFNEFVNYLWMAWITPTIDIVLSENNTERRNFFDNLVSAVFAKHSLLMSTYKELLKERNKILLEYPSNEKWISQVEGHIAETSIQIHRNRVAFIELINHSLRSIVEVSILGEFEIRPEINVIKEFLLTYRERDFFTKSSGFGVHKTNWNIRYLTNGTESRICSTGEQKAILIEIVLEVARFYKETNEGACLILLDEVFSHLDDEKIAHIINRIESINIQAFFTATKNEYSRYFKVCRQYKVTSGVCLKECQE